MASDREQAKEYHEQERSKKARVADESFRSTNVTEDYETWRQNPGRWDFEGVDTIPPERKRQRAERALGTAQEIGLVSEFVEPESRRGLPGDPGMGTAGSFQAATDELGVKSTLDEDKRQETLAHEVGHAVDFGDFGLSGAGFEDLPGGGEGEPMITSEKMTGAVGVPDETTDVVTELREVSKDVRGDFEEGEDNYRDTTEELFADFVGNAILRPRNTKAQTDVARESMIDVLDDPPEELEPSREFVERELPSNFFPGL